MQALHSVVRVVLALFIIDRSEIGEGAELALRRLTELQMTGGIHGIVLSD